MRYGFISLDAAGRTGADNPLTNLKVRQAIFHAIDRATIARTLIKGGARPLDAPCYPSQFGCDQGAAVPYDYNPAKAKELLAEAGYKDGVETELVTGLLPQWATALQNYLNAAGIKARLTILVGGAATKRQLDGSAPLYGNSWGSYSINDVSAGLPYFFSGDAVDYTHDDEVEATGARGWIGHRPRCAPQGVQRGDQADYRAGVFPAAVELFHHLCLLASARLQALARRVAAVLSFRWK